MPDWNALFEEAYKATKPGGWIQSHEPSCIYKSDHATITEDSALGQWGKFYIEGGKKMGNTCLIVEDDLQKKGMEAAGFVDIQEFNYKVRSLFRDSVCPVLTVLPDADGTLAEGSNYEGAGHVGPGGAGVRYRGVYPLHGEHGWVVEG